MHYKPIHGEAKRKRSVERYDTLIVGGGQAGAQAAIALKQRKYLGSIAIMGDEPHLPYERPPLSKDYLAGSRSFDRLLIRPRHYWNEQSISLLSESRVVTVDSKHCEVGLSDGRTFAYGTLVWAAGGYPRRLGCSGHDLMGVHYVRTCQDVDRIQNELNRVTDIVIVGGGYIGLETAATLSKVCKRITVLEAMDRVLARVAGEQLSHFYEAEHRGHDVDVRVCAQVEGIEGQCGRVTGVRLATGHLIPAQMVIVGIGILPAVEPLLSAGAEGGNGVMVDGFCRTSLPNIYAIGDCAAHVNEFAGGATIRLESVQNAVDQAAVVAKSIAGTPERYLTVPWFWSNQYDLKLQTVGLCLGHDHTVLRGDLSARSFALVYLKRGHIVALDCVNAPKDFVEGKVLVANGARIDIALLADGSIRLKEMARTLLSTSMRT
jgi:3-phenylpropionate/trans-cinnamate dioxygenase ferredoxin reductase component